MKKYSFEAVILARAKMDAAYIEFPYAVLDEFGVRGRVAVKASFDGVEYRGSLVKMGTDCHILGLTKAIRNQIAKAPGDFVHVELIQDTVPRVVDVPVAVKKVLANNPLAADFFKSLSYTHRKEYVQWITSAKREKTRESRLRKMEQLLESGVRHP